MDRSSADITVVIQYFTGLCWRFCDDAVQLLWNLTFFV